MSKVVVITGASRGLGFSLAKEFCKKEYNVVLNGRNLRTLKKAKQDIISILPHAKLSIYSCDVSKLNCSNNLALHATNKFSKIDYWINNAATCANKRSVLSDFTHDEIHDMINTNTKGLILGCKVASEIMQNQIDGGKIINIDGSGSNGEIIPGFLVYSATKSNISYIGRYLNEELKDKNVQVHTVSPGIMQTNFLKTIVINNKIFNSIVQDPDVVANIIVNQIESVSGNHKHIKMYTFSRLLMLLCNIFKKDLKDKRN